MVAAPEKHAGANFPHLQPPSSAQRCRSFSVKTLQSTARKTTHGCLVRTLEVGLFQPLVHLHLRGPARVQPTPLPWRSGGDPGTAGPRSWEGHHIWATPATGFPPAGTPLPQGSCTLAPNAVAATAAATVPGPRSLPGGTTKEPGSVTGAATSATGGGGGAAGRGGAWGGIRSD